MVTLVKQQSSMVRSKRLNSSINQPHPQQHQNPNTDQPETDKQQSETVVNTETHRILEKIKANFILDSLELSEKVESSIQTQPETSPQIQMNTKDNDPNIHLNSNLTKLPLETEEKEVLKSNKRNRNSTDAETSFTNSKKIKSANSSDYEDYPDEEDDYEEEDSDNLLIIESNEDKTEPDKPKPVIESIQEPETEEIYIKEKEDEDMPKSPTMVETEPFSFITPKIIPLNKSDQLEATVKESPKIIHQKISQPEEVPKTSEDKLSLFDLISKLQDKLVEAPSKAPINHPPVQASIPQPKLGQLPSENPREYTYIENMHENINYSLITLNSHSPIRVLVRYSTDGYINTEHSSLNSVVLYSKLEYQPQFGCERLSSKDLCRMWAKSYVRNCCDVFLCRINVFTSKLISVSNLKHDEILPKDFEFNPHQSLNHLKNLFESCMRMEKSCYLLAKEPNDTKLSLLKSAQLNKTYYR